MKEQSTFTEGKILSPLLKFALPVLLALFLQTMYGAVDMMMVGKYASAASVSAVSTGTWIMQALTTVIVGLAMGTTVLLGQRIGEKREDEAGDVIGTSILLFFGMGVFIMVAMQFLAEPFARLMQAPEEALSGTVQYVRICAGGAVFIVAYNVLGSVFRGMGDSKMPLLTVFIACVTNIAGDYLLVAVFGMAERGAAIATVFAQAVSVILSFLIIRRRPMPFRFARENIRIKRDVVKGILKLGAPIAFQDLLVTISFLVITAIVNSLGVIASAGVGVAEKLCGFIMLVPSAFSQSMSAFVAQNIGAKKPERARRALFCGIAVSLGVGIVMGYLSFFHGDMLSSIFTSDPAMIVASTEYLKAYAIDCLFVSFLFCFIGYFSGCGNTTFVLIQGVAGAFGARIPISYLMSRRVPVSLFLVGIATPSSTLVQITLCVIYYLHVKKRERNAMENAIKA